MLKEKAKNCGVVAADVKRCLFHTWTWESMKCSTGTCKGHLRMCPRKGRSNAPAWACLNDKNVKNRISFTIKEAKAAGEAVGARVRHRSRQGAGGRAWLLRASLVFALEIASR